MKSFCITGYSQFSLNNLAEVFRLGGSSPAIHSSRDSKLSIQAWHENVLARQPEDRDDSALVVGRLWDQVAIDIFLANHASPTWHWAEKNSIAALDYWNQFDPNIFFVIVYQSPLEALSEAFREGQRTQAEFNKKLKDWETTTRALLNFRETNPKRTLLIPKSLINIDGKACIKLINAKWRTKLTPNYLATQEVAPLDILPELLIASYINNHLNIRELERKADVLLDSTATNLRSSTTSFLIEQLSLATTPQAPALLEGMQKENFLLLNELEGENAFLLENLHNAQEIIESSLRIQDQLSSQLEQYKRRFNKLLEKSHATWEFDSITTKLINSDIKNPIIEWTIIDTYIDDIFFEVLVFKTVSNGGITGFSLSKSNGPFASEELVIEESSHESLLMPVKGSIKSGANAALTALSSTEWTRLNALAHKMISFLDTYEGDVLPDGIPAKNIWQGLINYVNTLKSWPKVMRYDSVRAIQHSQIENYSSLEITLKNIILGDRQWSTFTYRIATFSEEIFDKHPRLEFPEVSKGAVENWFIESHDSRGSRLELRLAPPTHIDTTVWHRLSDNDRYFIAALVSKLGDQMDSLSEQATLDVDWSDWKKLGDSIKNTFTEAHMSSLKSR